MKRFLLLAALIAVIIGLMLYFIPKPAQNEVSNYADKGAIVNIYCRQASCNALDLGLGYQVACSVSDFPSTLAYCSDVDGFSVSFKGNSNDVSAIMRRLQAKQVSCQQLGDLYVVCCYSPRLQGGVTLDNKQVNMQIAYCNGAVTVGYPLILGSY